MSISAVSSNVGMIQAAYNSPPQVQQKDAAQQAQTPQVKEEMLESPVEKTSERRIDVYA